MHKYSFMTSKSPFLHAPRCQAHIFCRCRVNSSNIHVYRHGNMSIVHDKLTTYSISASSTPSIYYDICHLIFVIWHFLSVVWHQSSVMFWHLLRANSMPQPFFWLFSIFGFILSSDWGSQDHIHDIVILRILISHWYHSLLTFARITADSESTWEGPVKDDDQMKVEM